MAARAGRGTRSPGRASAASGVHVETALAHAFVTRVLMRLPRGPAARNGLAVTGIDKHAAEPALDRPTLLPFPSQAGDGGRLNATRPPYAR